MKKVYWFSFSILLFLGSCSNYFHSPQNYLKSDQFGLKKVQLGKPMDSVSLYLFNDYKHMEKDFSLIWIDQKELKNLLQYKIKIRPDQQVLLTFNDHSDYLNLFGFNYQNLNSEQLKAGFEGIPFYQNEKGITFYYEFKSYQIVDSFLENSQGTLRLLFLNNPKNDKDPEGFHFKREVEQLLFEYNDYLWAKGDAFKDLESTSFGNYSKFMESQEDSTAYGKQMKITASSFVQDLPRRNHQISQVFQYDKRKPIEIPTSFQAQEASKVILSQTAQEKVVIFNEDHSNPENRILFGSLLEDFKKQGFTAIAFEALGYEQPQFHGNVPLQKAGFYTWEPEFGNLLRKAKDLDFEMYAYEDSTQNSLQGMKALNHRDSIQTENLMKIHQKHPKLLVFAGHGHIEETHSGEWKKMAQRFQERTQINPLTIEQAAFSNFDFASRRHNRMEEIQVPSVMSNDASEIWVGQKGYYDLQILFPTDANWYASKRISHSIPYEKVFQDHYLQIYKQEDPTYAIPLLVRKIKDSNDLTVSLESKGNFRYYILTKFGQILKKGDFSLK